MEDINEDEEIEGINEVRAKLSAMIKVLAENGVTSRAGILKAFLPLLQRTFGSEYKQWDDSEGTHETEEGAGPK